MSFMSAIRDQERKALISEVAKEVMEDLEGRGGIFIDIDTIRKVANEILEATEPYSSDSSSEDNP